jgi:hypothetical protein
MADQPSADAVSERIGLTAAIEKYCCIDCDTTRIPISSPVVSALAVISTPRRLADEVRSPKHRFCNTSPVPFRMRTVLVHLRSATEEQVKSFLTHTYPRQFGPPWICDVDGDACLYINISRDMALYFEPEELASLLKQLGGALTVSVSADVSGRHPGDEQVRDFVYKLLSQFEGLAEDDYTEGFWTQDDIQSERRKPRRGGRGRPDGHTFFDYRYLGNEGADG